MEKERQEIIDFVFGNDFIVSKNNRDKFILLLDKCIANTSSANQSKYSTNEILELIQDVGDLKELEIIIKEGFDGDINP